MILGKLFLCNISKEKVNFVIYNVSYSILLIENNSIVLQYKNYSEKNIPNITLNSDATKEVYKAKINTDPQSENIISFYIKLDTEKIVCQKKLLFQILKRFVMYHWTPLLIIRTVSKKFKK